MPGPDAQVPATGRQRASLCTGWRRSTFGRWGKMQWGRGVCGRTELWRLAQMTQSIADGRRGRDAGSHRGWRMARDWDSKKSSKEIMKAPRTKVMLSKETTPKRSNFVSVCLPNRPSHNQVRTSHSHLHLALAAGTGLVWSGLAAGNRRLAARATSACASAPYQYSVSRYTHIANKTGTRPSIPSSSSVCPPPLFTTQTSQVPLRQQRSSGHFGWTSLIC